MQQQRGHYHHDNASHPNAVPVVQTWGNVRAAQTTDQGMEGSGNAFLVDRPVQTAPQAVVAHRPDVRD